MVNKVKCTSDQSDPYTNYIYHHIYFYTHKDLRDGVYDCHKNDYNSIDSQDDQSKVGKYSDGTCNNECKESTSHWQTTQGDQAIWCEQYRTLSREEPCGAWYLTAAEQDYDICTNFANNKFNTGGAGTGEESHILDYTNFDWTCNPIFTADGNVIRRPDSHDPYCTCDGKLKSIYCQIFEDADRKLLNSSDPCFLK